MSTPMGVKGLANSLGCMRTGKLLLEQEFQCKPPMDEFYPWDKPRGTAVGGGSKWGAFIT